MPDPIGVHPKDQLVKRIDDLEERCGGGGGVGECLNPDNYFGSFTERFNDYRAFDPTTETGGNWSNFLQDHIEGYNNHGIIPGAGTQQVQYGYNHYEGQGNTITGGNSYTNHVEGNNNRLEGTASNNLRMCHVEGDENTITGGAYAVHVGGYQNTVSRYCRHSIVHGEANELENSEGMAVFGRHNKVAVNGYSLNTIVAGSYNTVTSHDSAVFGNNNKSSRSHSFVSGMDADDEGIYFLAIGNGHNIMTLDAAGNLTITGRYSGSGADYAEYFEWLDGNPDGEDRCGMLVTLDGDRIIPAHGDEIFGIISAAPSVVGNAYELHWSGKYARDIFGRIITTPDGAPLISPEYDPNRKYIPRSKRPEWAAVGMTGRLVIKDDGSCKPGGYVSARRGVGTSCYKNTSIRVLRRIDERHVEVIIR